MNPSLRRALESCVTQAEGRTTRLRQTRPVGGGCINDACCVETTGGGRYFVKTNAQGPSDLFEREAEGLEALRSAQALRVPRVVAVERTDGGEPFLVLEMIDTGSRAPDFSEHFGRSLAELHRRAAGERYGFAHDNYLGSTPQPNAWSDDWLEFWRDHRLGHQLRLARDAGYGGELDRPGERMMDRLDELIGAPDEPPALCHGDLWGGNYLVDAEGRAVLIDPAAYCGRREADLAMTTMFGGFDAFFYSAYREAWPLVPGWEDRLQVYQLYHHLNHLNLFGAGYLGGCLSILRRFA